LEANDALSGVAATHYTVDGGSEQSGASITISAEGIHTITYWSEDNAGNVEGAHTAVVKIDKTAPTISHTQSPPANANGWNQSDVTVTFVCGDSLSGVASCTTAQTITTEGAGQPVTGIAVDSAGNSATDPATVSIDKTLPAISAAADRSANANGWYGADVLVSFTCADFLSGIATCPAAQTVGEGPNQSASGTATDAAGNSASTALEGINVDKTAPTAAPTQSPPATGGWNDGDVSVDWNWTDTGSGIDSANCTTTSTSSGEGEITLTATCQDLAGNEGAESYPIKVDKTPPTASPAQSPAANGAGWNGSDVTVDWNWTDEAGGSGIDSANCTTSSISTGEGEISLNATCQDLAGNQGAASHTIKVDKTRPTASAAASPGPNAVGWNNTDVTVSFSGDDGTGSGIDSCSAPAVLSSEGAGLSASGTCTDLTGNGSEPATASGIDIDKTRPTLAPVVSPNPVALGGAATVSSGAADSGSGIASKPCGALDTATPGLKTVTCTATDNAGNAASATATYLVSLQTTKQTVLNDLTVLRATVTDKKDGGKLDEAIKHLTRSLDPKLWADQSHLAPKDGEKVFNEEKNAVSKLDELIKDKRNSVPGATLQGFINQLAGVDRHLATIAIGDAVTKSGAPKDIAKANEELGKGDSDIAAGKYASGIEHYRNAWQHAQKAMA
jgi:hypothetical protein